MVCFYHPTAQAVGICKNCQKGLCAECSADIGNGLACKNQCEAEVATINLVFERSKIQYQRLGSAYRKSAWWMGGLGIFFLVIGLLTLIALPGLWLTNLLIVILGIFLLISAAMNRAEAKKQTEAAD